MDHILPFALVLACPISMGVMMWFMMRGNPDQTREKADLERRLRELEEVGKASAEPPPQVPQYAGRPR